MHTSTVDTIDWIARTELWPLTDRKVPFALILASVCTGALFLVGLALSSQDVPHYPGIAALSRSRAGTIAFAVWAVTAGLLIVAVIAFAIVERRESGARSVLRLPRTRALLNWLVLAMALLSVLAFMNNGSARREQPAQEAQKSSVPIGPEERAQPPPGPDTEPRSDSKPSVQRAPAASWPWAVYATALVTLALAGAVAALTPARRRKPSASAPVAAPEQPADDRLIDPAWSDEEAFSVIQLEPDPRVAVIMCYRLFQSVLRQAEVRIEEHHTPEECGRIAVRSLKLPRRAVFRLVGLYSSARFSEHNIGESHKSAALAEARLLIVAARGHMAARAEATAESELKGVQGTVAFGPKRA